MTYRLVPIVVMGAISMHCGGPSDATPSASDAAAPTPAAPVVDETPSVKEDERARLEARVMQALRNRAVRALDVLLAAHEAGPMSYPEAVSYCERLDVERIDGWRLPSVGELVSLGNAGLITEVRDDRRYWSTTEADTFGDTRFAWASRGRRAVETAMDSGAYVVCVRRSV